jgi:predicted DNA-binding WGR domain protein
MNPMIYDTDLWQTWEWASETRYYCVHLQQDLFGDWHLLCCWGGLYNRLGNCKTLYLDSVEQAPTILQAIHQRREKRGYQRRKLIC